MTPEMLIGMLAELERIRELTLDLIERDAPRLLPPPPDDSAGRRAICVRPPSSVPGAQCSAIPPLPEGLTICSLPRVAVMQRHRRARNCATR